MICPYCEDDVGQVHSSTKGKHAHSLCALKDVDDEHIVRAFQALTLERTRYNRAYKTWKDWSNQQR